MAACFSMSHTNQQCYMLYCPELKLAQHALKKKKSESFPEGSEEIKNQNICWELKTSFMDDKRTICVASLMSKKQTGPKCRRLKKMKLN